jgi:putative ABC transport system permease protein
VSLLQALHAAIGAIAANKLRAALTVLGIIIGVAAVIGVMSIGRGAEAQIEERIESLGTNLIFVRAGAQTTQGVNQGFGSAQTLTVEDAAALTDRTRTPAVALIAPEVSANVQLVAGSANTRARGIGTTPEYGPMRNADIAEGRFIIEQDVSNSALVVVLGSSIAETLFSFTNPVGQKVRINNRAFTVVGVLEEAGGTGLGNLDDLVVIPLTTVQFRLQAQRTAQGEFSLQSINVQAVDGDAMDAASDQISAILRERHGIGGGEDDFTVTSQADLLEAVTAVTDVFTIFLASVAGISLLVGGIGIMNIMLVSVTERTREIGIRKAVGARRSDILRQFLMEAIALSFSGGALGVGLGWVMGQGFSRLTINNQSVETLITPGSIVLAVSVAVAIGLFFGLYPAVRASRLDPIQALRHE